MIPKMFFFCLSATILLVSLKKATAKGIPKEQFSPRNFRGDGIRIRRANEDITSYVEDLLLGKRGEQKGNADHPECGLVDEKTLTLKTNEIERWPWHVAVYHFTLVNQKHSYECGGTLIGSRTVVTAAHCVEDIDGETLAPETLVVILRKRNLFSWSEVEEMEVKEVVVHPDYSRNNFAADIAILILTSSVYFSSTVRPACLWEMNQAVDRGTLGTVVGWGRDRNGEITGELKVVKMPIVSGITCLSSYPEFYGTYLDDRKYCAGFRNGSSLCNGDAGGGMLIPLLNEFSLIQKWYLRGIVSLGPPIPSGINVCNPNHYIIFTDVSKFKDWIEEYLR